MHYNLTHEIINNIQFDDTFRPLLETTPDHDKCELLNVSGMEHYRLLAYISSLFHNTTILDIRTHRGNSALALSYNKSNIVHSFDIVNNVIDDNIKNISNIQFHIDNLFEPARQDSWKNIILQSSFIFLDVDPHNGKMEFEFYNYLKDINYQGFVICDDIWYFKEMRDNFWYNIPPQYKYDLTDIGHWSGTGIFTFNEQITFNKNDNSNWTLVTAYFNLTKCPDASEEINKRDIHYYINHAMSTLSLPYNLIIYCDPESYYQIYKLRPNFLKDKTKYIICELDDFKFKKQDEYLDKCFAQYRGQIIQNRENNPYIFDNRNTASYYLFCMSRYAMLKETIKTNPFNSTHFAWINFCIERMGYKNVLRLDEALAVKRDRFSTCYIDYIPENLVNNTAEYFKWGRCSMCSGFFTGNSEYMYKVCDLIENQFLYYMEQGYGHADEQLYSPVYFKNPELFEHYYGDYLQMVTNYKYIYDAPEPPINNFIQNSFQYKNLKKCIEACEFVLKSHELKKCDINSERLNVLNNIYNSCKHLFNLTRIISS